MPASSIGKPVGSWRKRRRSQERKPFEQADCSKEQNRRTADAASGKQPSELAPSRFQVTRGRHCLGRLILKFADRNDTSSWNRQAKGEAPPERTRRPDGTKRLTLAAAPGGFPMRDSHRDMRPLRGAGLPGSAAEGRNRAGNRQAQALTHQPAPRTRRLTPAKGASPEPGRPDAASIAMQSWG